MIDGYYAARGLDEQGRPDRRPSLGWTYVVSVESSVDGLTADTDAMATPVQATPRTVTLTIDGREVTAAEGTTIWAAAKAAGIDIPVLCHDERYDPVGVCRMCVVDVGAPVFAAVLRAAVRGRHGGQDRHPRGRAQPGRADRAAAGRPAGRASATPSRPPPATTSCSRWPTATG